MIKRQLLGPIWSRLMASRRSLALQKLRKFPIETTFILMNLKTLLILEQNLEYSLSLL